ncbi:MAG: hypothetical protein JSV96_07675 [Candidatus Aminicenantes bacterium]|nr:MAG: hypothetical protein JSV96_07675 [Candidatus Aminicenantes bacterium]
MKHTRALVRAFVFLGIATLAVYALQIEDLEGTWNGKMQIPNFGRYEMTLVLEKTESGYKGKVSDTAGYIAEGTEIEGLKIEDSQLFCSFELTDETTVYLSLTVEGDIMSGDAEREGGVVSCVFVREK